MRLTYRILDATGKLPGDDEDSDGRTSKKHKNKQAKKTKKQKAKASPPTTESIIKDAARKYSVLINPWPASVNLLDVSRPTIRFDPIRERHVDFQHRKFERLDNIFKYFEKNPEIQAMIGTKEFQSPVRT